MKKYFAFILALLLIAVILAGCTDSPKEQTETVPRSDPPATTKEALQSTEALPIQSTEAVNRTEELTEPAATDSTPTELVTEPSNGDPTEHTESDVVDTSPSVPTEPAKDPIVPTELEVIDEYIATGD